MAVKTTSKKSSKKKNNNNMYFVEKKCVMSIKLLNCKHELTLNNICFTVR